ncbi:MAG: TVP38/TMEM64 family protein [Gemmatimonadetes bacterium]|nr:TVP38/TMEM64 family protein [Gemmatimonadota bacterium]
MENGGARPPAAARRRRRVHWKKVGLAAVMLGALIAFATQGGRLDFETVKAHRAELLAFTHRHYAAMLIGATLAYTLATAISFPAGVLLTLTMGLLFGRWVGTAAVVLAASVGATLAFLAARYLFADAVRRRMGPRLQRLARGFERDAFNYILFVRLVPVFPFWLMNLVPAFTPVSARTFFVATAIGILPGTFVFVNLGESLGRIESPRDLVGPGTLVALALLGVLSLLPIAFKKLRTRRKTRRWPT